MEGDFKPLNPGIRKNGNNTNSARNRREEGGLGGRQGALFWNVKSSIQSNKILDQVWRPAQNGNVFS